MSSPSRFASVQTLLQARKFRVVPMVGDGNCFYRAVATAYYKDVDMHPTLRNFTMEHMLDSAETYQPFFETFLAMKRRLTANKRLGVWNSDLADLVPAAVASLLGCRVEVYSVCSETDEVIRHRFEPCDAINASNSSTTTIRLLHKKNHYELLLKD